MITNSSVSLIALSDPSGLNCSLGLKNACVVTNPTGWSPTFAVLISLWKMIAPVVDRIFTVGDFWVTWTFGFGVLSAGGSKGRSRIASAKTSCICSKSIKDHGQREGGYQ